MTMALFAWSAATFAGPCSFMLFDKASDPASLPCLLSNAPTCPRVASTGPFSFSLSVEADDTASNIDVPVSLFSTAEESASDAPSSAFSATALASVFSATAFSNKAFSLSFWSLAMSPSIVDSRRFPDSIDLFNARACGFTPSQLVVFARSLASLLRLLLAPLSVIFFPAIRRSISLRRSVGSGTPLVNLSMIPEVCLL